MQVFRAQLLAALVTASFCVVGGLRANPSGGSVAAGNVSITQNGSQMRITAGDRSIINWQEFSIASGEETLFIQPSTSATVLNRVVSGDPSSIFGTLRGNGQVYLINPNGILVGQSGVIDTAGFLASTLDVSNRDFLAGGALHFSGNSNAAISGEGAQSRRGNGDVVLIGRQISNSGNIQAAHGSVQMGAGGKALLKPGGTHRLYISGAAAQIPANGNVYALAINNSGVVQATGAVNKGGHILLTSSRGTIQNTGSLIANGPKGRGGRIGISGGNVAMNSGVLEYVRRKGGGSNSRGGAAGPGADRLGRGLECGCAGERQGRAHRDYFKSDYGF